MAQDAGNRYAGVEPAARADFDAVSPGREDSAVLLRRHVPVTLHLNVDQLER